MTGHPGSPAVMARFTSLPPKDHPSVWGDLWDTDMTPWDRGGPSAPLDDILTSRPDLFPRRPDGSRGTALVPGCGRGHDALLLASFGYDVVGLDLAAKAIREARDNEAKLDLDATYPLKEGVQKRGRTTWIDGNFFDDSVLRNAGVDKFDLIFDYTVRSRLKYPPTPSSQYLKRYPPHRSHFFNSPTFMP